MSIEPVGAAQNVPLPVNLDGFTPHRHGQAN